MVKPRKHGLRFRHRLFKRKNINNGSGDNNNNSNDGEKKTKEMVLDHPAKRRLMRLNNFGDTVRTGADPMEPDIKRNHIKQPLTLQQQQWLQLQEQQVQQLHQLHQLTPQQLQLQQQQLHQQLLRLQLQDKRLLRHLQPEVLEPSIEASGDGDGDGDGDGGSGSSGGGNGSCDDGDGDNNGEGKTEGGGGDGGKMESKGQHDNRNKFSYHGGDENGYPVGQLHRCYYEKTNVCSIIPYQLTQEMCPC